MDFDSILPLLFFFFFFILPSLLKRKKKKKKIKPDKKPSFFSRIGERIGQIIKEIEEQQRQQKKAASDADDIWQALADEDYEEQVTGYEVETGYEPSIPDPESIAVPEPEPFKAPEKPVGMPVAKPVYTPVRQFRENPLQNAVIWAEIIGKPVALK